MIKLLIEPLLLTLLLIWIAIDAIFLIILVSPLRKQVTMHKNEMPKRAIERGEDLGERLLDIISQMPSLVMVGGIAYILVQWLPDIIIKNLLGWYTVVFVSALFSVFVDWVKENGLSMKSFWKKILIFTAILISMVGYVIEKEEITSISRYRRALNILIALSITSLIMHLLKIQIEKRIYRSSRLSIKGIRKDLYKRTPKLAVNIPTVDLIIYCEKYFDVYNRSFKRIEDLHTVEYVNLAGENIEFWYSNAASLMKAFVKISGLVTISRMCLGKSIESLVLIGLMVIFEILVKVYKKNDIECLYRLSIRCIYDEWGYYLSCTEKNKFVGTVQMVERSKYHKFVYSFLDIAAFCRAIAFHDRNDNTKNICIISKNLSDLYLHYTDYNEKRKWTMVIPLWISALFEYYVTEKIDIDVKEVLLKSVGENVRFELSTFLQSFWSDMERKKIEEGVSDFVQQFEEELLNG